MTISRATLEIGLQEEHYWTGQANSNPRNVLDNAADIAEMFYLEDLNPKERAKFDEKTYAALRKELTGKYQILIKKGREYQDDEPFTPQRLKGINSADLWKIKVTDKLAMERIVELKEEYDNAVTKVKWGRETLMVAAQEAPADVFSRINALKDNPFAEEMFNRAAYSNPESAYMHAARLYAARVPSTTMLLSELAKEQPSLPFKFYGPHLPDGLLRKAVVAEIQRDNGTEKGATAAFEYAQYVQENEYLSKEILMTAASVAPVEAFAKANKFAKLPWAEKVLEAAIPGLVVAGKALDVFSHGGYKKFVDEKYGRRILMDLTREAPFEAQNYPADAPYAEEIRQLRNEILAHGQRIPPEPVVDAGEGKEIRQLRNKILADGQRIPPEPVVNVGKGTVHEGKTAPDQPKSDRFRMFD